MTRVMITIIRRVQFRTNVNCILGISECRNRMDTRLITAHALLGLLCRNGLTINDVVLLCIRVRVVLILIRSDLSTSTILVRFNINVLFDLLLNVRLNESRLTRNVIVLLCRCRLISQRQGLRAVFVLCRRSVLTLRTDRLSTTRFTRRSCFVAFLRVSVCFFVFVWSFVCPWLGVCFPSDKGALSRVEVRFTGMRGVLRGVSIFGVFGTDGGVVLVGDAKFKVFFVSLRMSYV